MFEARKYNNLRDIDITLEYHYKEISLRELGKKHDLTGTHVQRIYRKTRRHVLYCLGKYYAHHKAVRFDAEVGACLMEYKSFLLESGAI